MLRITLAFLFTVVVFTTGCKKCVECEVRLKKSSDVIGYVDEFCGNDKKVEAEEDRLRSDYSCIECNMNNGGGTAYSGVLCGDRNFTDSIKQSWDAGAANVGVYAQCTYYRDTANVRCVLKQ